MPGLGISMADMLCTEHVYNCIAGVFIIVLYCAAGPKPSPPTPVEDAEETYGHKEDSFIAEELNRLIVIIFEEYARWPTFSFSCQTQEFRKWLITNFRKYPYSFIAEELNRLIVIISEKYARQRKVEEMPLS